MDLNPLSLALFSVVDGIRALLSVDASSGVQKAPSVHAEGLPGDAAGVAGGEEHPTGSATVAAGAGDRCD
jgi:hypothetical protein